MRGMEGNWQNKQPTRVREQSSNEVLFLIIHFSLNIEIINALFLKYVYLFTTTK